MYQKTGMVCVFRFAAMRVSGIDRIVFYFLKDLVSDIHSAEPVYFGNAGRRIGEDGLTELFQFHADSVDLGNSGIGKGDGFLTIGRLDVESEDVDILGCLKLD